MGLKNWLQYLKHQSLSMKKKFLGITWILRFLWLLAFQHMPYMRSRRGNEGMLTHTDGCIKCSNKCLILIKPKHCLEPLFLRAGKTLPLFSVRVILNVKSVGIYQGKDALFAHTPLARSLSIIQYGLDPGIKVGQTQQPAQRRSLPRQKPVGGTNGRL